MEQAAWISKINDLAHDLICAAEVEPMIGTSRLAAVLGVGPREAQRILAPIVVKKKGKAGLAPVDAVVNRLRELAGADPIREEEERRRRFALWLLKQEQWARTMPRVLIEAPISIQWSDLDKIPGLELGPGRLVLCFGSPEEAKLRLLALAFAIGRDQEEFDRRVTHETHTGPVES